MVECKNCKYFISFNTDWPDSFGECRIILPPWLKVEVEYKTVNPEKDYCDLGIEKK